MTRNREGEYEPLREEELAALGEADLRLDEGDDHLLQVIHTALTQAHMSDLVFGGSTYVIDPSGWTKGTFPAVAMHIATALRKTGHAS